MLRTVCIMVLSWGLATCPALARKSAEFTYPYSQVWSGAIRLIRVDLESKVVEKDRDDGYFLFTYRHAGRDYEGSVEVVRQKKAKGFNVRVVVQVPGLPKYVEGMMLSKLTRKLSREYGAAPDRQKTKPTARGRDKDGEAPDESGSKTPPDPAEPSDDKARSAQAERR